MRNKGNCSEGNEYQIDQANLIRNLNDEILKPVINPTQKNVSDFTSYLVWESTYEPNKIVKNRRYLHIKVKPFTRYPYELPTNVLTGD